MIEREAGGAHVRHRRTDADAMLWFQSEDAEALAQPDDDARNATIADEEIGADADHRDGNIRRRMSEESCEIRLVQGGEQNLRPAAGAKPREVGERPIRLQPAAHL